MGGRADRGGIDQGSQGVLAPDEDEPAVRDAGERLEGGTGGPAAVRTMAVQRIGERIRHLEADGAAIAFASKDARVLLL